MDKKVSATLLRVVVTSTLITACGGGTKVKDVVDESRTNNQTTSVPPDPTPTAQESKPPEVVRSVTSESITPVRSVRANSRSDVPSFATESDYVVDGTKTASWNYDISAQSLSDINNLLCLLEQTNFLTARQGGLDNYCAWVDLTQCQAGTSGDAQDFADTSFQAWAVSFQSGTAVVDDANPMVLHFWGQKWILDAQQNKQLVDVTGQLSVTSHVTSVFPNGLYALDATYTNAQNQRFVTRVRVTTPDGEKTHIKYNYIDGYGRKTNAAFERDAAGVYGSGTVSYTASSNQPQPTQFTFAHDDVSFVRKSNDNAYNCSNGVCVGSRETVDSTVWRYSLYNDKGQRVQPKPAAAYVVNYLPSSNRSTWILATDDGTGLKVTQGSIGSSISTLHYDTYQPDKVGSMVPNFVYAKGILWRLQKQTLRTSAIHGWDLVWVDGANKYWVRYNKNTQAFTRYAQWNAGLNVWEEVSTQEVDVSTGELMRIRDDASVVVDGEYTVLETHARVRAGSLKSDLTLLCSENCPDPANITTVNPYHTSVGIQTYTFDKATMTLKQNNVAVTKLSGSLSAVMSGRLQESGSSPDVSYMWETGQRLANQSVHVLDENNKDVVGEASLRFLHVENEGANNASVAFLTYGGPGLLYGIPTTCVHKVTNQSVTCGNQAARRIPSYNLADGTELTAENAVYYVRAVGVEERIRMAAPSDTTDDPVSGVTAAAELTLQDASSWGTAPDVCGDVGMVGGVSTGGMCMGHGTPHIE